MKHAIFAALSGIAGAAFAQSAPERDARGVPVVSAPATAPAGANTVPMVPPGAKVIVSPDQSAAFTPKPEAGEVPPCSKTVTDRCKQTYERQGR